MVERGHNKKKRQHYVPRFILRNFASDERKRTICVQTPEQTILNASLRDQCYSDYFYGADGAVEGPSPHWKGVCLTFCRTPAPMTSRGFQMLMSIE